MLRCPFCDAPETDRIELDGRRFVVFGCMFTPSLDPRADDDALATELARRFGRDGSAYFRGVCDRLHLFVAKGPGAAVLKGERPDTSTS